jgi:hypothetical protein
MHVTVASATVAQNMNDVKLFCLFAFGEGDKHVSWCLGHTLEIMKWNSQCALLGVSSDTALWKHQRRRHLVV